jgi:hypothetical protein
MSDAETLWEAAVMMRRERGAHAFYRAVAEWLDVTAADVGSSSLAYHAALAAARAYLGET